MESFKYIVGRYTNNILRDENYVDDQEGADSQLSKKEIILRYIFCSIISSIVFFIIISLIIIFLVVAKLH